MRALITGVGGFVGKHLTAELTSCGYTVIGTDLVGEGVEIADLLDKQSVRSLLERCQPEVIFHLAGQASVQLSWKIPRKTFDINVGGTINLLETLHELKMQARVLVIGSSDQYGKIRSKDCPVRETLEQHPQSPYAISKLAQEQIALALSKAYQIDTVLTRSFNHIGVGQRGGFVVPDFASAIAAIEAGQTEPVLRVGNLEAQRDFTDVRDVVRAYRLLAEKGVSGEVYNIGSGKPYRISEILEKLLALSTAKIRVEQDPARMRVSDVPLISCCAAKLLRDTGWAPMYSLDSTLRDILADFRRGAK